MNKFLILTGLNYASNSIIFYIKKFIFMTFSKKITSLPCINHILVWKIYNTPVNLAVAKSIAHSEIK
jgi:hypothetical protein